MQSVFAMPPDEHAVNMIFPIWSAAKEEALSLLRGELVWSGRPLIGSLPFPARHLASPRSNDAGAIAAMADMGMDPKKRMLGVINVFRSGFDDVWRRCICWYLLMHVDICSCNGVKQLRAQSAPALALAICWMMVNDEELARLEGWWTNLVRQLRLYVGCLATARSNLGCLQDVCHMLPYW